MRKVIVAALLAMLIIEAAAQERKTIRGFDGGMMVHAGYLSGSLDEIGYEAKLLPLGPRVYFGFLFYH